MRTFLIILLTIIVIIYGGYVTLFFREQRRILFPAAGRPPMPSHEVLITNLTQARYTHAGVEGFAWYLPAPEQSVPQPSLIIAHGNGEISDDWLSEANHFRQRGYHVLLLEYPGYGHAPGSPSKSSIDAAALGGYDWLISQPAVDPNQIYLLGHSIGGAAVSAIADQRQTEGMVLLSPFASVRRLAWERYLPAFMVKDAFNNLVVVRDYDQPLLLMHGTEDTLIPFAHSETLNQAAPTSELIPLPCGHGGCIPDFELFWDRIDLFIMKNNS